MKHIITYFALIVLLLFAVNACSDVKEDLSAPTAKLSVHPEGIGSPGSENFHGVTLMSKNWDIKDCQRCHAADYSGGTTGENCLTCHTQPAGPEACNTCHGAFANPERIAPPSDLAGNVETSAPGVGAHSAHLHLNEIGPSNSCLTCHDMDTPTDVDFVHGHIDGLPAEMKFGGVATLMGVTPSYNFTDNTCSNTYCHGNFSFKRSDSQVPFPERYYVADEITGSTTPPVWNAGMLSEPENTTCAAGCHMNPPTGHAPVDEESCESCHYTIVNSEMVIINKLKHINGKVNVFGMEY